MSGTPADTLRAFADGTTIHGVKHISNSKYWIVKVAWLLMFIGAIVAILFQVTQLIKRYDSHPYTTRVTVTRGKPDFPSVTICNLNPLTYSRVQNVTEIRKYIGTVAQQFGVDINSYDPYYADWYTNYGENYTVYDYNLTFGGQDYSYYFDYYDPSNIKTDDISFTAQSEFKLKWAKLSTAELQKYDQRFDELVVRCSYGGETCDEGDFDLTRDDDYGICYTYPNKIKYPNGRPVGKAGPLFGLKLILNIQQSEYIPFVTQAAGVRVQIHPFGSEPSVYEEGFSVPPGQETSISFKLVNITRLSHPYGNCDDSNKYPSYLSCTRTCLENVIQTVCKCTRRSELYLQGHTICSEVKDLACVAEVIKRSDLGQVKCDQCKTPCTEVYYQQRLSSASWPSVQYIPVLESEIRSWESGFDFTTVQENMLMLRVHFSDLNFETITEEPAYQIENLISDLGGQLGLWAGLSVLSLMECLELLVILAGAICRTVKIVSVTPIKQIKIIATPMKNKHGLGYDVQEVVY